MSGQWLDFLLGQYESVRGDRAPVGARGIADEARDERLRVLVEDADGASAWATSRVLTEAGYRVATCPGPEELAEGCPLLVSGACSLADDADAVVFGLSLSSDVSRRVLAEHRARRSVSSLCVRVDGLEGKRYAHLLAGCRVVHVVSSPAALVQAAGDATRTSAS